MFSHINFGQSRTVRGSAAYIFANIKFHDFPGPGQKFHDFPGLESKLSNSMTFQVFQDRYEPWKSLENYLKTALQCQQKDLIWWFNPLVLQKQHQPTDELHATYAL